MAKVLVTAGPIPAKVDSVKFITNRFRGGLAMNTARLLAARGHDVTVACTKATADNTKLDEDRTTGLFKIAPLFVDDVYDYFNKVMAFDADAYVLAAAVANIGPADPWVGKFPSHNYMVGDRFPVEFTILPRVIDCIKDKRPRATLIGYKLFDGDDDALVNAARVTLYESKANVVFANHPTWAKDRKKVVTADGAVFDVSYGDHIDLIHRLIKQDWYKTISVVEMVSEEHRAKDHDEVRWLANHYPKYPLRVFDGHQNRDLTFGTFAVRDTAQQNAFWTTTRGKQAGTAAIAYVGAVSHQMHTVFASRKPTLNTPLLSMFFELNPHINYLIHGHDQIGSFIVPEYQFPGTSGDNGHAVKIFGDSSVIQLPHHGYIAAFSNFVAAQQFVEERT